MLYKTPTNFFLLETHGGRTVTAEGGPAKIFMKIKGGGLLISLEVGVDSYRM
jgi:hypothetical protein